MGESLINGGNMYKNVLLTDHEISLIRRVIGEYLHSNLGSIKDQETLNLHIIDRTLKGKKPTEINVKSV